MFRIFLSSLRITTLTLALPRLKWERVMSDKEKIQCLLIELMLLMILGC